MAVGGHANKLQDLFQLVYKHSRRGYLPEKRVGFYLGLCGEFVEIDITPALITPKRCEQAAQAGVESDETLVLLPQVVLFQHFAKRAEIVACVVALYDTNIWLVRHKADAVGVAIEDEDEVCRVV